MQSRTKIALIVFSAALLSLAGCSGGSGSNGYSYDVYVSAGAGAGGDGTVADPYQTINEALDDIAASRASGNAPPAVVHVAAGTYVEQVALEEGVHDNLLIRGSTMWNLDQAGRLDSVASDETKIQFATTSGFPGNYVVWVMADNVTIEDVVVEADFGPPPEPTVALTIDRGRGVVIRRVWAGEGFLALHARGATLTLDRTLTTGPAVGTTVEGGPVTEGGEYTLLSCSSRAMGNAYQLVAHGDQTMPSVPILWDGDETCEVYAVGCLAEGAGRGFQVIANLPGPGVTRSENEGDLNATLVACEARDNQHGMRFLPDNFGYSNFPAGGDAADSRLVVSLDRVSLDSNDVSVFADGANAPYLEVRVSDQDGSATLLQQVDGSDNWVAPSALFYNGVQVAP